MKHIPPRVHDGFAALREEPVPPSAKELLISRLQPARPNLRRWAVSLSMTAALTIAVLLPVPALGGSLQGTLDAAAKSARHRLRVYEISKGTKRLTSEVVVYDDRVRMSAPGSADLYWESGFAANSFGSYAVVEAMPSMPEGAGFETLSSIKLRAKSLLGKLMERAGTIKSLEADNALGRTELKIDAQTLRPIEQVTIRPDGTQIKCEWSFDDVSPQEVMLNLRAGIPIFNYARQREAILTQAGVGLSADGPVVLRALIRDMEGRLVALVDSNQPTAESELSSVEADGVHGTSERLGGLEAYENGRYVPMEIQGHSVASFAARFPSVPEVIKTLKVAGHVFKNVRPMQTGSAVFLLAPRNQPFWLERSSEESSPSQAEPGGGGK